VRTLRWVGSAKKDLVALPEEVRHEFGYALYLAQVGDKHQNAKPLRGFGGAGVLEVVEDFDGDTFRAVYTVRFSEAVYALHVFQKKSKHGIETSKQDIELIAARLKRAAQDHEERLAQSDADAPAAPALAQLPKKGRRQ
jgi:phage-related protein